MEPGQDVLASLLDASTRTWWLSDGRGAISHGTASGAATRREHALLATPGAGPRADWPAVSLLRFDDRVAAEDGPAAELTPAFVLASRGATAPALTARVPALVQQERFAELPWPRWRFRGLDWLVEREYRLIEGHPALLATWRLLEGGPVRLHVAPLLVARSLEGLQRETPEFRGATTGIPGRVRCGTVEGYAPLTLWHGGAFMPARAWHRGLAYPAGTTDLRDPDRGALVPAEDAFLPGWVQTVLAEPGATLHLVASTEEQLFRSLAAEQRLGTPPARTLAECLAMLDLAENERRSRWHDAARDGARTTLRQAAAARAAREPARADGEPAAAPEARLSSEHGALVARLAARLHDSLCERVDRTAVITHPSRLGEHGPSALRVAAGLVTLREFDRARDIVRGYLAYLDEGLAPESFDADGLPRHAGPETSLWLVHVTDLLSRRDDTGRTAAWLTDGAYAALEGVLVHLRQGSRYGVRCDRDGFLWAGEGDAARARADTNALWYHALVAMSQLARTGGRRGHSAFYLAWARELQREFVQRFWDDRRGALHGSIAPGGARSREIAPSQLLAVSLPPMLLPPELAARLVDTVTRELFDPRGLRPRPEDGEPDPGWLGPWAAATVRAHGRDAASLERARGAITRWARTGGAIGASGAAGLLRALVEELDHRVASPGELATPRGLEVPRS